MIQFHCILSRLIAGEVHGKVAYVQLGLLRTLYIFCCYIEAARFVCCYAANDDDDHDDTFMPASLISPLPHGKQVEHVAFKRF